MILFCYWLKPGPGSSGQFAHIFLLHLFGRLCRGILLHLMTFVSSLGSSVLLSLPLPFVAAIPPLFLFVIVCVYLSLPFFPLLLCIYQLSLDSDVCVSFRSRVFNACPFTFLLSCLFSVFKDGEFDLGGNSHLSIAFAGVSHGKDHRGWFTGAQLIIIIIIITFCLASHEHAGHHLFTE